MVIFCTCFMISARSRRGSPVNFDSPVNIDCTPIWAEGQGSRAGSIGAEEPQRIRDGCELAVLQMEAIYIAASAGIKHIHQISVLRDGIGLTSSGRHHIGKYQERA